MAEEKKIGARETYTNRILELAKAAGATSPR